MNKGIWAIIVATAFIAGTLMANPFAEAAGGWKEALSTLESDIGQTLGQLSCQSDEIAKWNGNQWACSIDEGADPFGNLQSKIDDKTVELAEAQSELDMVQTDLSSAQSDLNFIQNSIPYITCTGLCEVTENQLGQALLTCVQEALLNNQDPTVECADEFAAVANFECTCDADFGVDDLNEQIADLESQVGPLEEDVAQCTLELDVLEILLKHTET